MTMAIAISPNGVPREVDLGSDPEQGARETIGTDMLELHHLADDLDMWVDEESSYKQGVLPNPLASRLAEACGLPRRTYLGTAVFAGHTDDEISEIPAEWREKLLALR